MFDPEGSAITEIIGYMSELFYYYQQNRTDAISV